MDIEAAEAVDTLRADLHGVEGKLTGEIARVETSLTPGIESLEASLTAKIEALKRHTDVGVESLRDDIRIIAEGVVSISAKVDSLRR